MKIDIELMKKLITDEIEISQDKLDKIVLKAKEISEASKETKEKKPSKQWVFVAYDKDGELVALKDSVYQGVVVQIEDNINPERAIEMINNSKKDFNESVKGMKCPVKTAAETIEFVPNKIFKANGISIKNKKSTCYIVSSGF